MFECILPLLQAVGIRNIILVTPGPRYTDKKENQNFLVTPGHRYTDKKENQIFLIYKEIQNRTVAKSNMANGLLIYGEIFAHFLLY
jgi:hypothetical protein